MTPNDATRFPDMQFDIKQVLVSGNRVVVRGEVSGTPSGDFFGLPHTGKRFRIMAIDIQTIEDGGGVVRRTMAPARGCALSATDYVKAVAAAPRFASAQQASG